MVANHPKDWRKLCEAASKEEDPDKLMALVAEINKLLDERDLNRNRIFGSEKDRVPESSAGDCAA